MRLILGDSVDKLKELEDNSVDSIVTDPPYGLSFMGKKWDYDVPSQEIFEECLRVLKPGGYLLSFAGSRTYHRMAVRVEDAGFEIRDQIMWIYGSGFPKSHNISKGIDKKGGQNLSWFIDYVLEFAEEKNISKKELTMLFPSKNGKPTGWLWNKKNSQGITLEQYNTIKDFLDLPFDSVEEAERKIIGKKHAGIGSGKTYAFTENNSGNKNTEIDITAPSTDLAKQWNGWGTALKPAHEPIVMARKPLSEKTVVDNVLEWGTGGINIDESRVETDDNLGGGATKGSVLSIDGFDRPWMHDEEKMKAFGDKMKEKVEHAQTLGRFPANIILDEEAGKILNEQSANGDDEIGGASRFLYCPKTSKRDRNEGLDDFDDVSGMRTTGKGLSNVVRKCPEHNKSIPSGVSTYECGCKFVFDDKLHIKSTKNFHPTVKPTDLMLYLIRLVTPKGGTTLDPFMGSGSTGKAAIRGGFDFIGIEREKEYMEIAEARTQYETDNPYSEEKEERIQINKNANKFF